MSDMVPFWSENNISIYHGDFRLNSALNHIQSENVDLVVTSPPYNLSIDYGENKDNGEYGDYLMFTHDWLRTCYHLSREGGRLCVNIPLDTSKGGQQSFYADFIHYAKMVGWNYHTTIIWNEGNISKRTAWGSWKSASAPYIISPVETIVVMYKGDKWKRSGKGRVSDITRDEFIQWTNGLWTFSGEKKKVSGHPAAFPLELPKRCIKLFSFVEDTVLDPFNGSGSTLVECSRLNRKGIGVEIEEKFCKRAIERISENK